MTTGSDRRDPDSEITAASVSFGGETVKATAAKFTMALSGFAGTILFARWLGAASFGGFYLVLSIVRMTDRPIGGWGRAIKKRFAESNTDDNEMFGALLLGVICWDGLAIIGAWLFSSSLQEYTGLSAAPRMFSLLIIALSTLSIFALVEAKGLVGISKWIDTLRSYLTLGLQALFVSLSFGAAGMAYGLSAATLLMVPIGLYYLPARPSIPSHETLTSIWSFARYSIPISYVGKAYDRFDVLLLGYLLAPSIVANYEVAARLTLPATYVAATASSLLMPRVSELDSRNENVSEDITNAVAFSSILAVPIFFGSLAIPESLVVTVYGAEYEGAWALLAGLAAYRVLNTQTDPLYQTLDGLGKPHLTIRLSTAALLVNIPLGIALVGQIGAVGVVYATIVAEFVRYLGAAFFISRTVPDVDLLPLALLKQVGVGIIMFAAVLGLDYIVDIGSWGELLIVVGAGAFIYTLGLLVISHELRDTIRGVTAGTPIEPYAVNTLAGIEFLTRWK